METTEGRPKVCSISEETEAGIIEELYLVFLPHGTTLSTA